MKRSDIDDRIIELLSGKGRLPLTAAEIGSRLKLPSGLKKRLQKTLNGMAARGAIVCIKNGRYLIGKPADLVAGRLTVVRSGNGFVKPNEAGDDVFVAARNMGTALPSDQVLVRLEPTRGGRDGDRLAGKVIRILKRSRNDIVGTLTSTGRFLNVVPIDPIYTHSFYVPNKGGAEIGDRVVVRFAEWKNKHVSPEAEVVEVLGAPDSPSVDTLSIIRHHNLRDEFPPEVVSEAGAVSARVNEPGSRLDLRDEYILTIDPERSRDFDDALSLGTDETGNRVLGIHIADVSHFVEEGSALDREALSRGNSVYLPDKVLPMLPEQLSNGVCSLKPDTDRLAFSVFLTLDPRGKVLSQRFAKTWIRSKLRLTYQQVLGCIGEGKETRGRIRLPREAVVLLRKLHQTAQQFRKGRFARYALNLDVPECEVVMDGDGVMTGIRVVDNDVSHQLVEECMVAANEAVAAELRRQHVTTIARFHDKPKIHKIEELTDLLVQMGYAPGNLNQRRVLAGFLKKVENDPLAHHVRVAVLKSMNRAVYSAIDRGHYGLAKTDYTHFTSPIRRYTDLVVHRQLAALVSTGDKGAYSKRTLLAVALNCTDTEGVATQAERALIEIKKYRFLESELKAERQETYEAVVVSVLNFGMFVELSQLQVQGLVAASAMSDRFVSFNRKKQTLRAGNKTYNVGMSVNVYVTDVDFDGRRIDFGLA